MYTGLDYDDDVYSKVLMALFVLASNNRWVQIVPVNRPGL